MECRSFTDSFQLVILNRTVFEAIMKIIFLSCHPEHHESVYTNKPPKENVRFNVTNLMNDLSIDWKFIWGINSTITHGKSHAVLFNLCDLSRGKKQYISRHY